METIDADLVVSRCVMSDMKLFQQKLESSAVHKSTQKTSNFWKVFDPVAVPEVPVSEPKRTAADIKS